MLNNYIRRFHQFPATPVQTSYLETYSSDSADNVRLLSRVFNLLTNFNGPEIFDNADDLPVFSGVAQVYQYEDKMFSLDMTGNILYVGPGVAVIRDVVTDFTETTELDVTSDDSWFNTTPLNQPYPPSVDGFTDDYLYAILSLYKTELSNDPVQMCLVRPSNYGISQFRQRALPIARIKFDLDENNDILDFEVFDDLWHNISNTDPDDSSGLNRYIYYKKFPFTHRVTVNGGRPRYSG